MILHSLPISLMDWVVGAWRKGLIKDEGKATLNNLQLSIVPVSELLPLLSFAQHHSYMICHTTFSTSLSLLFLDNRQNPSGQTTNKQTKSSNNSWDFSNF